MINIFNRYIIPLKINIYYKHPDTKNIYLIRVSLKNLKGPQFVYRSHYIVQSAEQIASQLLDAIVVQVCIPVLSLHYKKYSPARPLPAGTARCSSGTALKMLNFGLRSSPTFIIDATLPQR